jgi:hypothetical protein
LGTDFTDATRSAVPPGRRTRLALECASVFPGKLLRDFRTQASDAPDDEHEPAKRRRKAQVVQYRGECPVDVDWQRPDDCGESPFHGLDECDPVTGDPARAGHLEQNGRSRVGLVHTMAKSRQPLARLATLGHELVCRVR